MVRRFVKVLAVLAVVIVAVIFILPAFTQADLRTLRTSIFVGTSDGERQHFAQDTGAWPFPPNTIVKIGGVSISYIRWLTDYQATSPDYTQYTVVTPSSVRVELFYEVPCGGIGEPPCPDPGSGPLLASCGVLVDDSIAVAGDFNVATWYSIGADFMGNAAPNDETARVTAAAISVAANSGCVTSGPGTVFSLAYTITISVQAIGVGTTPTDSVQELLSTSISIELGSITGVVSTTVESG